MLAAEEDVSLAPEEHRELRRTEGGPETTMAAMAQREQTERAAAVAARGRAEPEAMAVTVSSL